MCDLRVASKRAWNLILNNFVQNGGDFAVKSIAGSIGIAKGIAVVTASGVAAIRKECDEASCKSLRSAQLMTGRTHMLFVD